MNILGEATSHNELIEAMRARKEALGLSNAWIEHAMNLSEGHCDKILGPARERGLSQLSIDGLLSVLAIKLIIVEDETAAARIRPMWSGRNQAQVRPPARIAASLIRRALPHAARELGRRGGLKTWRNIAPQVRTKLMTDLIKRRWSKERSVSPPAPQQKPVGVP
jgi:hypothetical protein